jgi:hypothetical protein
MTEESLISIIKKYQTSFSEKIFEAEETPSDILMEVFGITAVLKNRNRQYWGRELGKCWESLVIDVFKQYCPDRFTPPFKHQGTEPCDLIVGDYGIDTKYRVGSGDSKTLSIFRKNARIITEHKLKPVLLFVREDNLKAAMSAFSAGGWSIYTRDKTFEFIQNETGFDLKQWLIQNKDLGKITK